MNSKPELINKVMSIINWIVSLLFVQFLSVIFTICFPHVIFSQTPPFYHYTSAEGLASSSVYDMIQDRNGFMWFATVNGVSRFDGKQFKNYSSNDGLNSNNILSLTEDYGGCIYFANKYEGFNIYNDGKIERYSEQDNKNPVIIKGVFTDGDKLYSYDINNISQISPENIRKLFFLNLGVLPDSIGIYETKKVFVGTTVAATKTGLYLIENTELGKIKTIGVLPDSIEVNKITNLNDRSVIAATTKGLYKFENQELKKNDIKGLDEQEILCISSCKDNSIVIGAKGKIFDIKNNEVIRSIEVKLNKNNNVTCLNKDTKGNIWFSIEDKGFYYIKNGTNRMYNMGKNMGIENTLVKNIIEDYEGNIWISTFGDGVFCINNFYLNNYNYKDGLSNNNVLAIEKDQSERIFIGTSEGLNILDKDSIEILNNMTDKNDHLNINEIKCLNNSVYISGTFNYSKIFTEQRYKNDMLYLTNAGAFFITKESSISGYKSDDLKIQTFLPVSVTGENIYFLNNTDLTPNISCVYGDNSNNLWIGSTTGLCKITNGEKTFFYENEILNTTIKFITGDRNNNIWIAGNRGVASFRLKDSLITNYTKISGYDLYSSSTLAVDNQNRLWIGSMNGLFILSDSNIDSVKILNIETGLPSNEITSLYYDTAKNLMWIGSSKGLSSVDVSEFDNEKMLPINVMINKISSTDTLYQRFTDIMLKPEQNNLHIDLTATNFSTPKSVKYQYKFENEWIDVADDYINFASLKKGDYRLEIRGKVINSNWGKPTLVTFTVLPKFFESSAIQAGIFLLTVLGILYGANMRTKNIKQRSKENLETNNQINDLKHKALSSMMNPHFIFNSLNSVQHLINIDRKREANDYISLMARLIRMNLETASESYIKLEDEINRLDLYLQIEKLRFSGKFDFEISTGTGIDPGTIMIPNMIIQPFVENSIWHGIMPSVREGLIKISFNFENVTVDNNNFKFLTIRITDNGIGLTEAQKNKKDGHVSLGIQIIQDRLVLLSKEKNIPKPIFEDLSAKNKNNQGTEVVLSIPPEMYKTLSN